ncbi:MAG: hypothetical protein U0228_28285 [Myxococcaceae bacterium]
MLRALALGALVFAVSSGCLPKVPRQRLSEPTKIAVGLVVDPGYAGVPFAPPDSLWQALVTELADHNLQPVPVPLESLAGQRLTDARFEVMKKAPDAQYLLLVEQRVQFFSQIDGRYRWEVGTALAASRVDGPVAKDTFEIPVVLMFDHQKEKEAIATCASDVSNRAGVLLDGVIASANAAAAPAPAPAPAPK